ncbi:hypothetical protein SAMCFNEI73_Ch2737 [Sinorhizobium americanum]|uniref:Uncharacterized protein n=1 Tax=Sinorhizobium americanum TaxID=194963 RepID=A0A1L3LPI0_9HYPH|nr:hypothetical protein SAMCCGM7_Ch2614 [Sinorhizobium americanum CCGM7]APG92012.1 hypothetical protein SAMCFNEI73_Ch2737 [Sinorhizobium americanum]
MQFRCRLASRTPRELGTCGLERIVKRLCCRRLRRCLALFLLHGSKCLPRARSRGGRKVTRCPCRCFGPKSQAASFACARLARRSSLHEGRRSGKFVMARIGQASWMKACRTGAGAYNSAARPPASRLGRVRILQELRGPGRQERERYGPAPKPGFDAQLCVRNQAV